MTLHVRIITPHITPRPQKLEGLGPLRRFFPQLELSQVGLDSGPASIEGSFDEALCAPGVIQRSLEAQQEGIGHVVIDCMGDPGLEAAREAVSIAVLGSCESSLHVAAMLGHRFSVVTVLDRVRPLLERRASVYGVREKLASVRAVNVPVLEIENDRNALVSGLLAQAKAAIVEDRADTIVLGCTGFIGLSDILAAALRDAGCAVPVLDPLKTAVAMAMPLAALGLSHSQIAFPRADFSKRIQGFAALAKQLAQQA